MELGREVISLFYKDKSNRVRLNSLVVLQEERSRNNVETFLVRQEWDVVFSRRFGYIFHNSGCGGDESIEVSGIYHTTTNYVAKKLLGKPLGELVAPVIIEKNPQWVDSRDNPPFDDQPRTIAVRKRNQTRRLNKLPKHIDSQPGQDVLDWLENNGIEGESVWCSICRDYMPGENYNLCDHCWWCEHTGTYSTPNDRCSCETYENCVVRY